MIVVAKDRQEGKTTDLAEWVKGGKELGLYPYTTRVVVVMFDNERTEFLRHGLKAHQVVTFATFRRKSALYAKTEVAIDNAEYVLEWALGLQGNLKAVSINTAVRHGD